MPFEILSSNDISLSMKIDDIDLSIVNALRRIILSEIPNVAFAFDPYDSSKSDITIYSNTSSLHNEFLAHRLSLIPLCFDESTIDTYDKKKYRFVLKKQNTTSDIISVTTNDFDIYDETNVKYPETFKKKIFPMNPITKNHILITKLKPNLYDQTKGEDIDIECYASVNIAKEHARWCPVSKCTFHNALDLKAIENIRKTIEPSLMNKFETLDKYRYFKKNKYDEPNSFEFEIDSECRMTPKYLLKKAFDILLNKISNFSESLPNLDIESSEITDNMFIIRIHDTHTLLNVLQSMIFNNTFRGVNPSNNPLEFIGYNQPHPLDTIMILKLKFKSETMKADMIAFMQHQCIMIYDTLQTLQKELDDVLDKK